MMEDRLRLKPEEFVRMPEPFMPEESLLKQLAARVDTPAAAIERVAEQLIIMGYGDMMKIDADLTKLAGSGDLKAPGGFAALLHKWAQEVKGGKSERREANQD